MFSPTDAGTLASVSEDGTLRLWDLRQSKSAGSDSDGEHIDNDGENCIAFRVSERSRPLLFDSFYCCSSLLRARPALLPACCGSSSSHDHLLSPMPAHAAMPRCSPQSRQVGTKPLLALAWSPNGRMVACGGDERTIAVFSQD